MKRKKIKINNPVPTDAMGSSALADRVRKAIGTPLSTPLGTPKVPAEISVDNIGNNRRVSTPVVEPVSKMSSFAAELSAPSIDTQVKNAADVYTPESQRRNETKAAQEALLDRILNRRTQTSLQDERYVAEVDPAQKELDDIQSQIEAKRVAHLRNTENIQKNAVGRETSGVQNALAEAERQYVRESADLSIIESAKLRKYDTAKAIADRAIAAELEQDQNEINALTFWYQDNKEQLNRDEDRRFNFMISERNRLLSQEEQRLQQISNIKLQAAQYGATPTDLAKIGQAKTFDEALTVASSFLGKPFALQLRAQNFLEEEKTAELASKMLESTQKANDEFAKTDEYQAVSSIQGQISSVDEILKNIPGVATADREILGANNDAKWKIVAKDSSAIRAIVNAELRATNPDLKKLGDSPDPADQQAFKKIVEQRANEIFNDQGAAVSNLKQSLRATDSAYKARITEANKKLEVYRQLYPGTSFYTTYQGVVLPQSSSTPSYQGIVLPN